MHARRIRTTPSGRRRGGPFSGQMGAREGGNEWKRLRIKGPAGETWELFRARLEGGGLELGQMVPAWVPAGPTHRLLGLLEPGPANAT